MKRKSLLYTSLLLILLSFSLFVQSNSVSSAVSFEGSITIGSTFEWVVKKYEITERPVPEAFTFFKKDDTIKIEIIANPPTLAEYWGYIPDVNFTDWMKFYVNDVLYNTSEDFFKPLIFMFGFIYPISITEDNTTTGFFEHYTAVVEEKYTYDLTVDIITKLDKNYFEEIFDQTADVYIKSKYFSRKYNIHTGLLSEYKDEFNNYENSHYAIEIVNPDDSRASIAVIIPIVTLAIASILFRRKKRKSS
ncbi:MAG: hypothetical protein GPJ51_01375 [Candidatus Heimdallarchaeota archaeon]|nr:hypothetical protein [Candidatus Heimdallarchaeota archaeon]